MSSKKVWGHKDRWLISKVEQDRWYICAPGTSRAGWVFDTGAEALAAFAKGDPND